MIHTNKFNTCLTLHGESMLLSRITWTCMPRDVLIRTVRISHLQPGQPCAVPHGLKITHYRPHSVSHTKRFVKALQIEPGSHILASHRRCWRRPVGNRCRPFGNRRRPVGKVKRHAVGRWRNAHDQLRWQQRRPVERPHSRGHRPPLGLLCTAAARSARPRTLVVES